MSKPITIYRSTKGLNNRLDPARLPIDFDTGTCYLPAAYNVDIDDSGRLGRRKGFTLVYSGDVHSIFCDGGECLFVKDTTLYRLNADFSATSIRTGMTQGARMSCVQVNEDIYYTNGHENGIVRDSTNSAWSAEAYVGPTTTKTFSSPPVGDFLELYNGRIYVVQADVVWYSEPFAYSWFNLAANYLPFASRVQMFSAVAGGIFVSDEDRTVFLAGPEPKDFQIRPCEDFPAVRGTAVRVPGEMIGPQGMAGRALLWLSRGGICVGGADGSFRNLTDRTLVIPGGLFGAGLYKDGKYITTLEP